MRLTKQIRENILKKAMGEIPVINYKEKLEELVKATYHTSLPAEVRKLIESPTLSRHLRKSTVCVKDGNRHLYSLGGVYAPESLSIRVDDASFQAMLKTDITHTLVDAIRKSGFVEKATEQLALRKSIQKRLTATLNSVSTVARLYDVLEPELHYLIPKEDDKTANLPAAAAPVCADMKRMGAKIPPDMQKAS